MHSGARWPDTVASAPFWLCICRMLAQRARPCQENLTSYTWPGSSWRPSACWADVIATRPQVLHVHCSCVLMSNAAEGRGFLWQPPEYTDTPPCITAVGLPARRRTLWRHALGRWRGLWLATAANSITVKQDYCHQHLWSSGYDVSLTR